MKSILNAEHKQEIISRINSLTAATQPLWGKMNVAQLMRHLAIPLELAMTNPKPKRGLMGKIFGGMAKKNFLGPEPFKKNGYTPPEFKVESAEDFEKRKNELLPLVNKFSEKEITDKTHPFFGHMEHNEWGESQWKHFDHHLRQFGV
jgi:hypothetical protein